MGTLHDAITFLVSIQIIISSLQTHNVNRCGRSRHLARKLSLMRKRSSPNVFEMAFFFSSRRRHTSCLSDLEFRRVLFRSLACHAAGGRQARRVPRESGRGPSAHADADPLSVDAAAAFTDEDLIGAWPQYAELVAGEADRKSVV